MWFHFLQLNEEKWQILKNHFCSVFSKFYSNTPFLVQIKYRDQILIFVAKFRVFTFQSRPVNALYNPTDHMKLYTELLHRPFRKYTRRNMFFFVAGFTQMSKKRARMNAISSWGSFRTSLIVIGAFLRLLFLMRGKRRNKWFIADLYWSWGL